MKPEAITLPQLRMSDFLEDALAAAETYARSNLAGQDFDIVAAVANDLIDNRIGVVARNTDAYDFVRERQPGVDPQRLQSVVRGFGEAPDSWPPWARFVVEFIIAERGVDRSLHALNRYKK